MIKQYVQRIGSKKGLVIVSTVIRILTGAFLVFSAYAKFISSEYYLKFMMRLGVPPIIAFHSVTPLIAFEFLIGILLIVGYRTRLLLRVTSLLFMVFTAVVTYSMIIGIDVSCGCFGPYFRSEINYFSIGRNLIIAILTFLIGFYRHYPFTVDSRIAKKGPVQPPGL